MLSKPDVLHNSLPLEGKAPALKIALDPTDGDPLTETDGVWNEAGYWTVPYVSEGYYLVVK